MMNTPSKYPHIKAPALKLQLRELFSGVYLQDLMQWKTIPLPEKIKPKTVLIIPGFGGGDMSVLPLKKFLRTHSHKSYS